MFSNPIKSKRVNKDITAYQYPNGTVNIDGKKYLFYTLNEAIKKYKQEIKQSK